MADRLAFNAIFVTELSKDSALKFKFFKCAFCTYSRVKGGATKNGGIKPPFEYIKLLIWEKIHRAAKDKKDSNTRSGLYTIMKLRMKQYLAIKRSDFLLY